MASTVDLLPSRDASLGFFSLLRDANARTFLKENFSYSLTEMVCLYHPRPYTLSKASISQKSTEVVQLIFDKIEALEREGLEDRLFSLLEQLSVFSPRAQNLWFSEFVEAFEVYSKGARTQKLFDLLSPYLIGNSLIDIGCGRGDFLNFLNEIPEYKKWQLYGTDIVDYRKKVGSFDFIAMDMSCERACPDKNVDTGLLLYVLHHINSREGGIQTLLNHLHDFKIKRLLVLEDVLISGKDQTSKLPGMEKLDELILMQPQLEEYLKQPLASQYAFTAMMDILSNCLFQRNHEIPYPFSFGTISHWNHLFEEAGWKLIEVKPLGFPKWKLSKVCNALFILEPIK